MNIKIIIWIKEICIVKYPDGGDLSFAQGGIKDFDGFIIKHLVPTHPGSSGSPILLQNNFQIIGIHKASNSKDNENIGIFIQDILTHFLLENNFIDNQIICEYDIKNENEEDIQILNCMKKPKNNILKILSGMKLKGLKMKKKWKIRVNYI